MLFMRSLLFSVGMTLATIMFASIALLLMPAPYYIRYQIIVRWNSFIQWWLQKTCRIDWQVEGLEHIPDTPSIIMSKHQSSWETIFFQRFFPMQTWVLKRELLWIPMFGWALASLKPIAIDRQSTRNAVRQIIEQGTERLKEGIWVVIFPEGTRMAPGSRRRYGIGGALLAEHSGHLVVPVAHNAGHFWPRNSFIKQPGTVRMVIGPPINPEGKSAQAIITEIEQWIETTMQQLEATPVGTSSVLKT